MSVEISFEFFEDFIMKLFIVSKKMSTRLSPEIQSYRDFEPWLVRFLRGADTTD